MSKCGDCKHEHQVESVVTRCECGCRNMVKPMTNTDGAVEAATQRIVDAMYTCINHAGSCECGEDATLIADTASRTATAAAMWKEHRPATSDEHGIEGRIHGYCRRCIRPWPCEYSPEAALTAGQGEGAT